MIICYSFKCCAVMISFLPGCDDDTVPSNAEVCFQCCRVVFMSVFILVLVIEQIAELTDDIRRRWCA